MATKDSGWSCTHSASVISESNSTATIRVTAYWTNSGWNYDIGAVYAWTYCDGNKQEVKSNGTLYAPDNHGSYSLGSYDYTVSKGTSKKSISCKAKITSNSSYVSGSKYSTAASVSISALPSYTVSYNANGGSGAPSSQTKWYKQDLTLSSTKPTRSGYSFAGWATSSSGAVAYQPGGTYTANSAVTLYAKWTPNTYTVKYNANGGSGAPSNQTKTYGVNLTLSSTKPTRTNYNFLGWSTSASGSVVYKAGGTYTNNSAVTLYAVWELAYVKPRINNFSAHRCNANGVNDETGTYIKYTFDWATDYDVVEIWLDWATKLDYSNYTNFQVQATGKSGSVSQVVGDGEVSIESTYYARVFVKDTLDSSHSLTLTIGTAKFPIDVKNGGIGVAIGKVAEYDNLFDVGMEAQFRGQVKVDGEIGNQHGYYPAWRGYISDANAATTHGFYHINTETINLPENVAKYGFLETIESRGATWDPNDGSSWVWQTFTNTSGEIFQRYGVNDLNMSEWKPAQLVYKKGDVINIEISTAGYLTDGASTVVFLVPLSKPIVGNPTISVSSNQGIVIRHGGSYTHGSGSGVYVLPSGYKSVTITPAGIVIKLTMGDTTNATTRNAAGIDWSGIITLS